MGGGGFAGNFFQQWWLTVQMVTGDGSQILWRTFQKESHKGQDLEHSEKRHGEGKSFPLHKEFSFH